ncbi:MAG: hypothetical protein CBC27_03840 [Opitutia bacterium TMED67]|jgi:hypothetical protein|nr:hypothetical protein [Verrucomicrobiales bacterium]OUU73322.1 MAG: hypothetical protein CBC27_03840 [Opitutae bacterium TMED67]
MSDTIKAWHEMQEEKLASLQADEALAKALKSKEQKTELAMYIFLLDFTDGKVYRYDVSSLCNEKNNWNPDSESCESFLYGAGHKVNDCEWMVTKSKTIEYGN